MFQDIKSLWKNFSDNKTITSSLTVQYCILRAMNSKSEDKMTVAKYYLRKSFTPVTRQNKLNNGWDAFDALYHTDASVYINRRDIVDGKWVLTKIPGTLLGVRAEDLLSSDEIELYDSIYKEIKKPSSIARKYTYLFTRQDIFDEYQLVQTAHAALELGSRLSPEEAKGLYFTVVGVPTEQDLTDIEHLLDSLKKEYVTFREPDIGNEKTSIAVFPISEHKRGVLLSYNLLRFNREDKTRS